MNNDNPPPPSTRAAEVFSQALDITDLRQRGHFLDQACQGDPALRQQVEKLLAHHKDDSFLEHPAAVPESTVTVVTAPRPQEAGVTLKYFGDYELLEEVARGGMGVVWKARQKSLNRTVAVKMILGGQLATEADVKRFHTEAEAAANLKHPNIVAIHEIGEHEGRHYFSMDLIEGQDLARFIDNKPMPAIKAAELLKTVCEAVHYAHQRGTLHRDLKPQNILMDAEGRPHITDFGLAKQMASGSDLTQSGSVMGSPSYMPPEQALGRQVEIGPASDVYSLGAILYQMLTGKVPFVGPTAVETLRMVIEKEPVAPSKVTDKVPSDLETICLKCLEKKPERRYASARALAEELDRFLKHEPILAKPASRVRRAWSWMQHNPWALSAASGVLLLLAVMVAYGSWERSRYYASQLEATRQSRSGPMTDAAWDAQKAAATRVTQPPKESPARTFLILLPAVCMLLYFADKAFKRHYRDRMQGGTKLMSWHLLVQGGSGAIAVVVGIGYLLLQFRSWIWLPFQEVTIVLEIMGVLGALALAWLGLPMVWRALGSHETSHFRGAVDQKLERELATENLRWSTMQVILFTPWLLMMAQGLLFVFTSMAVSRGWEMLAGFGGLFLAAGAKMLTRRVIDRNQRVLSSAWLPLVGVLLLFLLVAYFINSSAVFLAVAATSWLCAAIIIGTVYFRRGNSLEGTPKRVIWSDLLLGAALLAFVFSVFRFAEGASGRQVWNKTKTELEAKGEPLDWSAAIGTKVPDEQNIMVHPFMRKHFVGKSKSPPIEHPLLEGPVQASPFTWSALSALPLESNAKPSSTNRVTSLRGILDWYGRYAKEFGEIEAALKRPQTQFWGNEKHLGTWGIANAYAFGTSSQAYANLCKAHLLMGDGASALNALKRMRKLAHAAGGSRPMTLYSASVKALGFELLANTIEETMAKGTWTPAQLQEMERLCLDSDIITDGFEGIRGGERPAMLSFWQEEAFGTNWLVNVVVPGGWRDRNRANYARLMQLNLEGWDPVRERLNARLFTANQEAILSQLSELPALDRHMANIMMPNFSKGITAVAKTQTALNLAAVACVLERHRSAKGIYPESLAALVPEFTTKLPHDFFDGEPLRYRRTDDGSYLLYSIGWDTKDDDGVVGIGKNGKQLPFGEGPDWVWEGVPAKPAK